jgi:hypothetical protein
MRLTCPCCGAQNSLEALLTDAAARQAVAAALALPGLGDRLTRYLGLFRPTGGRGLTWDRVARLLEELNAALAAGQVERHGQVWPAPLDYWKIALDQMLDNRPTLTLPLKTHGYLYEVVTGLSRKATEATAVRQEADEERARARDGERCGQMQPAAAVLAARPEPRAGKPAPVPPPAAFRDLLNRLKGTLVVGDDARPPAASPPLAAGE